MFSKYFLKSAVGHLSLISEKLLEKKPKTNGFVLMVLMLLFAVTGIQAQTQRIIPAGDGNFSNGSTFAANGWTVANQGRSPVKWAVGTAASGTSSVGSVIAASTAVTLTAANANIAVGQIVYGLGIPANTFVSAIAGTSLTLSQAATVTTANTTLGFGVFSGGISVNTAQITSSAAITAGMYSLPLLAANPNIAVGMLITSNSFIAPNTYVASISGTTLGLSQATTAASVGSQTLTFAATSAAIAGNAAYVSNDNGATNSYAGYPSARTVYFYRDITTVPANEKAMTLTFDVKSPPVSGAGGGGWQVWVAPTSQTVAGTDTQVTTHFTYSPTWLGANATLISFNSNPQVAVTKTTAFIPKSFAGTSFRLIFVWTNGATAGTLPPAAIDNISLTSRTPEEITSARSGLWSQTGTWDGGKVPTHADTAVLDSNLEVVMVDSRYSGCENLTLAGTNTLLQFAIAPATIVDEFIIHNDLNIAASGARFNNHDGTTGKYLKVGHDFTVGANARFDSQLGSSGLFGRLNLNGSTVQTVTVDPAGFIGGSAAGVNTSSNVANVLSSIEVTNTNTASPNVIWDANGIRIKNGLVLTSGRVRIAAGKRIILGNFSELGSGLVFPLGSGFTSGTVSRYMQSAGTRDLQPGAEYPGTFNTPGIGLFPFVSASGQSRATYVLPSANALVAGEVAVTYSDVDTMTSVSVPDGAYTIDKRYGSNWTVSTPDANAIPLGAALVADFSGFRTDTQATTATGMGPFATVLTIPANAGTSFAAIGQLVTGTNIAPGTYVTGITGDFSGSTGTLTLSQPTTNNAAITSAVTLSFFATVSTTPSGMPALGTTLTLANALSGIRFGQLVSGTNIAPGTTVTYVSGTTLTLSQPTTNVVASSSPIVLTFSAAFRMGVYATGAFQAIDGSSRLMKSNAAIGGLHQDGTSTPYVQRNYMTLSELTSEPIYVGTGNASVVATSGAGTITSTVTGGDRNWNTPATWVDGVIPTCSDNVVIASGATVNVTAAANAANVVNNGTLVNNGGTMTVGCSGNKAAFVNNGTHTMTIGNLVVNGFVAHKKDSFFNQSGGEIIIDSNDNGNVATSVALGGSSCKIETGNLNLTGGKITIVDPLNNISTAPIVQNSLSNITVTTEGATGTFSVPVSTTIANSSTIVFTSTNAVPAYFWVNQKVSGGGITAGTTVTGISVAAAGGAITLTLSATTPAIANNTLLSFSSMQNGSSQVVMTPSQANANTSYIGVGFVINGTGIPVGATVLAVASPGSGSPTAYTLSAPVTGLGTSPIASQQTFTSPAVNTGATFAIMTITNPSIFLGQTVSGTGILPGTFVTAVDGPRVIFSNPIQAGASSPLVLTFNQETTFTSGSFVYNAAKHYAAGLNHTLQIGDGVSTQKGSTVTNGFNCVFNSPLINGTNYLFSLGNLIVNAPDGDNRFMSTSNGDLNTFWGTMNVQNKLTITTGSVLKKTFGNSIWYVGGDIENNGKLLLPIAGSALYLGNYSNGVAVSTTLPQTISGTGIYLNSEYALNPQGLASGSGSVGSMEINNTSAAGVTLAVPNFRAIGGLTMTNGILHTSSAYPILVGNPNLTALSSGTISGGSATSFIDGPASSGRVNPGNISLLVNIPLGKGTTYLPFSMATLGTAPNGGFEVLAEAFLSNAGSVNAANASGLSTQRWKLTKLQGTFDYYNVKVGASGVTANTVIVQAPVDEGVYDVFAPQAVITNDLTTAPPTSIFAASFTQATTATGMPATSTTITLAAANTGIKVGQVVTGTNIVASPATTVTAISGTTLTLSQATTNTAVISSAVTLTFEGRPRGNTFTGYFAYATAGSACSGTPAPGNTLASSLIACAGNPITLSLATPTVGSNVTYQWRSSVDAGTTWVTINGATAATYLATPTVNTSYACTVTCSSSTGVSNPVAITMSASTATTTPLTICEAGSAVLGAAGSTTLNWYDAPTGGNLVATGTSYSPTVAATTTFYVSSASESVGNAGVNTMTAGIASSALFSGIAFDVTNKVKLKTVTVYPKNTAALRTPITVSLFDATGNIVAGTAPVTFTPNLNTGAFGAAGTSQNVTLNYNIPVGTGYRLVATYGLATDNTLGNSTTPITYPTSGAIRLTGNVTNLTSAVTTTANTTSCFHNLTFDEVCESVTRTPVIATVGCTKNLKLFIEGYYDGSNTMRSVKNNQDFVSPVTDVCDVTVELRNATAPYAVAATTTAVLKTDGSVAAKFSALPAGNYFIAVKHRNAIETWSAAAEAFGAATATYDFSSAANKAYGDNMKDLGGVFGFYSGDLNQDGFIEGEDYPFLQNASEALLEGDQATDLNGDGFVEGLDFPFFFNNSDALIESIHP